MDREGCSQEVRSVNFSFMSEEDLQKTSVVKVTKKELLIAKVPVTDGLYDPRMGPLDSITPCGTCHHFKSLCPGHCGHIELVYPIYHPLLFSLLYKLLKRVCLFCHHFMAGKEEVDRCVSELNLIIAEKLEYMGKERWTSHQFEEVNHIINDFLSLKGDTCHHCKKKRPKLESPMCGWICLADMTKITKLLKVTTTSEKSEAEKLREQMFKELEKLPVNKDRRDLFPTEVKEILKDLWEIEKTFCDFIGNMWQTGVGRNDYSIFFLEKILVSPTKLRAPTLRNNCNNYEDALHHPNTSGLIKVLQSNINLEDAHDKLLNLSTPFTRWKALQKSVNVFFDSKTATVPSQWITGICQMLEKKEGLFRKNMMGKDVNHAGRCLFSPDPYIGVNEIGIPRSFAMELTYPERVTSHNSKKLREVMGTHVKSGDITRRVQPSNFKLLSNTLLSARDIKDVGEHSDPIHYHSDPIREGKFVYRHMQDGDVVLVNHQPSLHKPSIMAHIVRILNGEGENMLRLHYANCSAYNAAFDGDEMNVHFPQDEISRAEAYEIVNANNQYARPSNGEPLQALIQDHIVSAVLLTKRDTFLEEDEFYQLLFSSGVTGMVGGSFSGRSGKKVIESAFDAEPLIVTPAILKPVPLWTGKQVITAVLNQITKGHPPFTVEKSTKLPVDFFKCRSREVKSESGEFIDELLKRDLNDDKLVIRKNEFVCGVIDKAQFAEYGLVHTVHELYGSNASGHLLSVFSRLFTVFLQIQGFTCGVDDLLISKKMDEGRTIRLQECERVGEQVHRKTFGIWSDILNVQSRVEQMICADGESASSFLDELIINELNQSSSVINSLLFHGLEKTATKNSMSLMTSSGASGSKVNFQQISSHLGQQIIEGKRVPLMVSGKTLPCFHPWDLSSRAGGFISDRFLTGLRPQEYFFHCMAGRERLVNTEVKTSRSAYMLRSLIKNLESLKVNYDYTVRDADGSITQFQYGEDGVDVQRSSFIGKFKELTLNQDTILQRCGEDMLSGSGSYITKLPKSLAKRAKQFLKAMPVNEREPVNERVTEEKLLKLVKSKFFESLAQPGEPVGVLAAQSVGEASRQMTSNRFHLAGRGEMNVTLGIPRLQEILLTSAAKIKTPIMTCPLLKGKTMDDAHVITDKLRKITVADIIKSMDVSVVPYAVEKGEVCSVQKLTIKLYKPKHYPKHSDITKEDWKETMNAVFLRELEDAIEIHMKRVLRMRGINMLKPNKPKGDNDDPEDDDEGKGIVEMDYMENSEDEKNEDYMDNEEDEDLSKEETAEPQEEEDVMEVTAEPQEEEDVSMEEPAEPQEEVKVAKKRRKFIRKVKDRNIFVGVRGNTFKFHFKFPRDEPHILLSQIALETAQKVCIQNSVKIKSCTVTNCGDPQVIYYGHNPKKRKEIPNDRKKATPALIVSGIDFSAFWEFQDELDVRYAYTNSIQDMLNTFGVEAARETIIREFNFLFKLDDTSISIRHLNLIADYMTFAGGFRPMSRMGGIAVSTSPFCRMSYETTTKFLVQAATYGENDNLETPSARICLGLPPLLGTGCFDLLQKWEYAPESEVVIEDASELSESEEEVGEQGPDA